MAISDMVSHKLDILQYWNLEMLDKGLKSQDDVLLTKVLIEINEDFH